jgi:hypothetical protein
MKPLARSLPILLLFSFLLFLPSQARADGIVITNGGVGFFPGNMGSPGSFTLIGQDFYIYGGQFSSLSWTGTASGMVGDYISPNSIATGFSAGPFAFATINGTTYSNVTFGGTFTFQGTPFQIGAPYSENHVLNTTATFSGVISVYACGGIPNCAPVFSTQLSGQALAALIVAPRFNASGTPYYELIGGSYGFQRTVPTPEPATLILLGTGLVAVVGAVRRRRITKEEEAQENRL